MPSSEFPAVSGDSHDQTHGNVDLTESQPEQTRTDPVGDPEQSAESSSPEYSAPQLVKSQSVNATTVQDGDIKELPMFLSSQYCSFPRSTSYCPWEEVREGAEVQAASAPLLFGRPTAEIKGSQMTSTAIKMGGSGGSSGSSNIRALRRLPY
jgi:hypothetical protein